MKNISWSVKLQCERSPFLQWIHSTSCLSINLSFCPSGNWYLSSYWTKFDELFFNFCPRTKTLQVPATLYIFWFGSLVKEDEDGTVQQVCTVQFQIYFSSQWWSYVKSNDCCKERNEKYLKVQLTMGNVRVNVICNFKYGGIQWYQFKGSAHHGGILELMWFATLNTEE